jgi:hypothetical protein
MEGSDREAGPKAMEEKTLKGRKPRRVRFGGRDLRVRAFVPLPDQS